MRNYFLIYFLVTGFFIQAQSSSIKDSLVRQLNLPVSDTQKVNILIQLSRETLFSNASESMRYGNEALKVAQKSNFKKGLALACNAIANAYDEKGDAKLALENYEKALKIASKEGFIKIIGDVTGNIGTLHAKQGDYQTCLNYFLKALDVWEKAGDKNSIAMQLANIGALHQLMGQFDEALSYQRKGLRLAMEQGDSVKIAVAWNEIGLLFINKKLTDSATIYLNRALALAHHVHDWRTITNAKGNLGEIYENAGDYKRAIDYIRPDEGVMQSPYALANAYEHLGMVFYKWNKTDSAENYLLKSIALADSIKALYLLKEAYGALASVYRKAGKLDQAVDCVYRFAELKDTLLNQEKVKQMSELATKYETEKKEAEIAKLNAEKDRDSIFKAALAGGIFFLLALALILLRGYRQKQKSNRQLEEKNRLIIMQKHMVEEKQKEILDSINYARRIQRAYMPTEKYVDRNLRELQGSKS